VVGISQQLAAAIAAILLFGGLLRSCEAGGFSGFVSFLLTLLVAGVGYVVTMVSIESLQVFLDIEENTRELRVGRRDRDGREPGGDR
jgi:hypothetical protein